MLMYLYILHKVDKINFWQTINFNIKYYEIYLPLIKIQFIIKDLVILYNSVIK